MKRQCFNVLFFDFLVTVSKAQSTTTDDMDETITYSNFESDSDLGPIFFMEDDMSTDGSDNDDGLCEENIPNNQNKNQNNVSKFSSFYL